MAVEGIDQVHPEPRVRAVYRVFLKYQLGHARAIASAHNAASALLIEEYLVAQGEAPDPEVTPERAIRSCLVIHEHDGFQIPPGMVEEAVLAWTTTDRGTPR